MNNNEKKLIIDALKTNENKILSCELINAYEFSKKTFLRYENEIKKIAEDNAKEIDNESGED